jgi:hypothetical protein
MYPFYVPPISDEVWSILLMLHILMIRLRLGVTAAFGLTDMVSLSSATEGVLLDEPLLIRS